MAEEIYIELPEQKYIHAVFSRPADAITHQFRKSLIIFVHDFPGNFDGSEKIFSSLQNLFLQRRHASLRFNFRGCGKSDGQTLEFTLKQAKEDLTTIITWAESQGYEQITLIAEGIAVYFLDCETFSKTVKNAVLLWPALDNNEYLQRHFQIENYREDLDNNGFFNFENTTISKTFIESIVDINFIKNANNFRLPVLAFHGKEDKTVPIANLNIIREHLGSKRIDITTFDDGTHGLPMPAHRKAVATHILNFIERFSLK